METKIRTFIRVLSWRLWSTFVAFFITWAMTGHLGLTISLTAIMFVIQTIFHMMHERVWDSIEWGRCTKRKRY
jgi:uncharacterized membrane protein